MYFNGCCFVCASEWLGIDPGEDYCICHETELLKDGLASAKERICNDKRYEYEYLMKLEIQIDDHIFYFVQGPIRYRTRNQIRRRLKGSTIGDKIRFFFISLNKIELIEEPL